MNKNVVFYLLGVIAGAACVGLAYRGYQPLASISIIVLTLIIRKFSEL
jgi:hypothetical protein